MPKVHLKKKIDAANEQIIAAQGALDLALEALAVLPRAQKTTISTVVQEAFAKLRVARTDLTALSRSIGDDEGEEG